MNWDLPISVEINGQIHPIRNECDYRVVLDVFSALDDNELTDQEKIKCALFIFYEDVNKIDDLDKAIEKMFYIISGGEEQISSENKPKLMDWEHDFNIIAPPISRVVGYDIRTPKKYTHFFTFLGGYMEIGESVFSTIVSIRSKIQKGKKLEKWEKDFYKENIKIVNLPQKLTAEEQEFLDSDW